MVRLIEPFVEARSEMFKKFIKQRNNGSANTQIHCSCCWLTEKFTCLQQAGKQVQFIAEQGNKPSVKDVLKYDKS